MPRKIIYFGIHSREAILSKGLRQREAVSARGYAPIFVSFGCSPSCAGRFFFLRLFFLRGASPSAEAEAEAGLELEAGAEGRIESAFAGLMLS